MTDDLVHNLGGSHVDSIDRLHPDEGGPLVINRGTVARAMILVEFSVAIADGKAQLDGVAEEAVTPRELVSSALELDRVSGLQLLLKVSVDTAALEANLVFLTAERALDARIGRGSETVAAKAVATVQLDRLNHQRKADAAVFAVLEV